MVFIGALIHAMGWAVYWVMHPHLPMGMECVLTLFAVTAPMAVCGLVMGVVGLVFALRPPRARSWVAAAVFALALQVASLIALVGVVP